MDQLYSNPVGTLAAIIGTAGVLASLRLLQQKDTENLPPYAPGRLSVVGHMHHFMKPVSPQELFRQWSLEVGSVFTVQLGQTRWVVLNSMKAVKNLIVDRSTIYSSRKLPDTLVNDIMGGADEGGGFAFYPYGKHWRTLRRIAHTGLVKKKIDLYQPILDERRSLLLSNIWEVRDDKHVISLAPFIEHFTMTTILAIAFGDMCNFEAGDPRLHEAFTLTERTAAIFGPDEQLREFFPVLKKILPATRQKYADIRDSINDFYGGLLAEFKKKMEEDEDSVQDCFLKQVLKSGELTDLQIMNFVTVFVGAGSETTASTIEWMLALLANHPEIQDKVYEEITEHVGSDRLPGPDDERMLPYLQCIIHETLRLRPPAPLAVPHATSNDDVYEGWVIPADTTVVINLHAIHQDPIRYPDPTRFNPDRHMNYVLENIAGKKGFRQDIDDRPHLSFSTGRRVCVGIHLAERSLYMAAAGLLTCYRFERQGIELLDVDTPKDIKAPTFSPRPYKLRVVPRHINVDNLFSL